MKLRTLVINAIIAGIYATVSIVILPLSFGALQFRIGEMLNHLIVFDKRYFFGIIVGVFIANLFSAFGLIDVVFGVLHTALALGLTTLAARFIKTRWKLMLFNSFIFSALMWIIALVIMAGGSFSIEVFFITWAGLFFTEFLVMTLAIPLWQSMDSRLKLETLLDEGKS
ncbi:QueT transporter family protein [Savagea faecisuis]|uniref:QueT transporter family protein n=1 Tax=Savagea faecisuis TaxID=1274803 RepID=A0ABW3GSX4_9BACL